MSDSERKLGRIRYIEPSNFTDAKSGNFSDMINFPYEDYNMAVDLSVRVANRYSCGLGDMTGDFKTINYSTNKGTLSFFGGTKLTNDNDKTDDNYLTVNYTDISMTDPSSNTSEALGIESINITYDSWMYPQVTIRFVDVRGATVMLPSENGYYTQTDDGMTTNIYKSFFSFPYPIFTLKVKGFYGKGVTYKLAVQKVSMEFDSNSGNFIIVVKFIGYMFGIYADFPMTYLAVAPYLDGGKEYWQEQIANGTFKFLDAAGNTQSDMITIPELKLKLYQLANSQEYVSVATDGQMVQDNLDKRLEELDNMTKSYPFADWKAFSNNSGSFNLYNIYEGDDGDTALKSINKDVKAFYDNVVKYDETYGTSHAKSIEDLKNFNEDDPVGEYVRYCKDGNECKVRSHFWTNDSDVYDDYIKDYEEVINWIMTNNKGYKNFLVVVLPNLHDSSYYSSFNQDKINEEKKAIQDKKTSQEREYKEKQDCIAEKALGFRPSIKNIYDLMFAHMETFLHCFYTRMGNIRSQLESHDASRSKDTYGLKDGDTDTERVKTKNGEDNGISRAKYLPPFTGIYKEANSNGETVKQMVWPGDIVNGNNLEEVPFVEEILKGTKLYAEEADNVEKMIAEMSAAASSGNTNGDGGGAGTLEAGSPTPTVYNFIPLTTYDFVNKDTMGNPYKSIRSMIDGDEDSIDGSIMAIFAMRALYFMATNSNNCNSDKSYSFGVIDALNLYKAVGDNKSVKFINFIKKYADDSNNNSENNEFINNITTTENNNVTKFWQWDGENTNKNLMKKEGSNVSFNLYKNSNSDIRTYLPLGITSLEGVKSDYAKGSALRDDSRYLVDDGWQSSGTSLDTFNVLDVRDYIKNLYNVIETEIKNSEEKLSAENSGYTKRDLDDFGKLAGGDSTLSSYEESIGSIYKEKLYDKSFFRKLKEEDGKIVEEDVDDSDLKSIITEGDINSKKSVYIRYVTSTDEKKENPVFTHKIYTQQTKIIAQAYLFLMSLSIQGDGDTGGIEQVSRNGLALKSRLLREGAYYWRQDNMDAIVCNGFKVPAADESFVSYKLWTVDGETISPIPSDDNSFIESSYNKWKVPEGCTRSRRKYLKKYFMDWANDNGELGWLGNRWMFNKKELFVDNDITKGLNVVLASETNQSPNGESARRLQNFLRDIYFSICTVFDYYSGVSDEGKLLANSSSMQQAFKGFCKQLHNIYGDTAEQASSDPTAAARIAAQATAMDPFNNKDIKLSTYITLKALYDKWLCNPPNGTDTWKLDKSSRQRNSLFENNGKSDFNNFIYIDNYYHKIGLRLTVNITKISEWLSNCLPTSDMNTNEGTLTYTGKSLYEFLSEVAQNCGALLIAFPQRFSTSGEESLVNMFRPYSVNSDWNEDSSAFVFLYQYKPSSMLGDEHSDADMNGWSRNGDGFNLNDDDIIGAVCDDDGYTIPAFGVTFAKQNQAYFKNLTLNTESPGVTEAGINAVMAIASKASEAPRETTLFGQDLYRVYSQYAYQCGVECMGNMQITPLMYFQLNNIPLWKGAYMIKKVTHDITAGNIVTKFEGIRQNKYSIPITECFMVTDKETGGNISSGSESGTTSDTNTGSTTPTTSQNYSPTQGNSSYKIKDTIDFDESNVTTSKPIICITPAHGPTTGKKQEWAWSNKLVDSIISLIKSKPDVYKFKDGTPMWKNLQKCNKNGNHTNNKGYSGQEIRNIIKKYGSDKVISMVPHWNGGGGNYFYVFYALGPSYKGGTDDSGHAPHPKSIKFAEIYAKCAEEYKKKVADGKFNPPEGAMSGKIKYGDLHSLSGRFDAQDPAVMVNCPAVLTENWFADYRTKDYSEQSYDRATDATKVMRPWMESQAGLNFFSEFHATAIKRFIDTL